MVVKLIHRYLGLISMLVIFIISIAGCIYCFHDEIDDIFGVSWRKVQVENTDFVKPSVLITKSKDHLPQANLRSIVYMGRSRSVIVEVIENGKLLKLYFNPYSSELLKISSSPDFFNIVLRIHRYLLLPPSIGKNVTGISAIIFLFLILTGIIRWLSYKFLQKKPKKPKKPKKTLSKSSSFYLHYIIGIYVSAFAIIIALTGLVFTFSLNKKISPFTFSTKYSQVQDLDSVFDQTKQVSPPFEMLRIIPSIKASNPIVVYTYPKALLYSNRNNYYFNPSDGSIIKSIAYKDKTSLHQVIENSYGIHTGQYFGIFGKVIVFVTSLSVSFLALTGFIIWIRRQI